MKDKTFLIILALVTLAGIAVTTVLAIHGYRIVDGEPVQEF